MTNKRRGLSEFQNKRSANKGMYGFSIRSVRDFGNRTIQDITRETAKYRNRYSGRRIFTQSLSELSYSDESLFRSEMFGYNAKEDK